MDIEYDESDTDVDEQQASNAPDERSENFVCDICNEVLNSAKALQRHKYRHTGRYVCNVCNKRFSSCQNMGRHRRLHATEKQTKCPLCERRFVEKYLVKRHIFYDHKDMIDFSYGDLSRAEPSGDTTTKVSADSEIFGDIDIRQLFATFVPYTCDVCGRTFGSIQALRNHVRRHTAEKQYACPVCEKKFTDKNYQMTHTRRVHAAGRIDRRKTKKITSVKKSDDGDKNTQPDDISQRKLVLICTVCDTKFETLNELLHHCLEQHLIVQIQDCNECCATALQFLTEHECCHSKDNTGNSNKTINNCSEDSVASAEDTEQSVSSISAEQPQKTRIIRKRSKIADKCYKCWDCNDVLTSWPAFRKHRRDVHVGKESYRCSICSRVFRDRSVLEGHERGHRGERPFKCTKCSRTFTVKSYLTQHIKNNCGRRKYLCKYCGMSLTTLSNLKYHTRLHTNDRPFQCPLCKDKERLFVRSDQLTVHLRSHRKEYEHEIKDQIAAFSDVIAQSESNFHVETVLANAAQHPQSSGTLEPSLAILLAKVCRTKHVCPDCGKQFYMSAALKQHIQRVHTDERPYSCTHCSKTFSDKSYCARHIRIVHLGEKRFSCTICDRKFSVIQSLKCHLKSHERKKELPNKETNS